jgi:HPr kinase/phosphorylase
VKAAGGGTQDAAHDAPSPRVAVRELLGREAVALGLRLLAGRAGLDREILMPRVQRPGLALSGYTDYISYGRVQIVGGSEIGYLRTLTARARARVLARLARCRISCFVVTRGLPAPAELLREGERRGIPVLATASASTPLIKALSAFLEERLALCVQLHAVLVDVFGLGVLIKGESGIGKSECALDLVDRGHRLVADDVVELRRVADTLQGSSPALTRYHMELRGVGVIDLKDLYGVSSVRLSKRVELVVDMERFEPGQDHDRLGLRRERDLILGLEVPMIRLPVAPGRSTALLVEVAARNQLLRQRGYDAARRLARRVDRLAAGEPARPRRRPRGARVKR